jgi:hypothetical protein
MDDFNLAEAIIEFAGGTEVIWNSCQLPIPNNVLVYTTDSKKFKKGNGVTIYAELPDGPSIDGIADASELTLSILSNLIAADEQCVIIIDNEMYDASSTTIDQIVSRLSDINNKEVMQSATLDNVESYEDVADNTITASDDNKLTVVTDSKLSPGILPETLLLTSVGGLIIFGLNIYSDIDLNNRVLSMSDNSTYYVEIDAMHDDVDRDSLLFNLTCPSTTDILILNLGRGKFSIEINDISSHTQYNFTAYVTNNGITLSRTYQAIVIDQATVTPTVGNLHISSVATYSDLACTIQTAEFSENSVGYCKVVYFHDQIATNLLTVSLSTNNGSVTTTYVGEGIFVLNIGEVSADADVMVTATVAYDTDSLTSNVIITVNNALPPIMMTECTEFYGFGSAVFPDDNFIVVGYDYQSNDPTKPKIIKFDQNFNKLKEVRMDISTGSGCYAAVIDNNSNVFAVGFTNKDSGMLDALIVKTDSDLNSIVSVSYDNNDSNSYESFTSVDVNSIGNVYSCGYIHIGNRHGIIVKFDNNLNLLVARQYSHYSLLNFKALVVDHVDNIYCCGHCEDSDDNPLGIIIKFDVNLNILIQKTFPAITLTSIDKDQYGNIYCVGHRSDTLTGVILKVDENLNAISCVELASMLNGVFIDSDTSVVCVGYNSVDTNGDYLNRLIVRMTSDLSTVIAAKMSYEPDIGDGIPIAISKDTNNNVIVPNSVSSWKLHRSIPSGSFYGPNTDITMTDVSIALVAVSITSTNSAVNGQPPYAELIPEVVQFQTNTKSCVKDILY